MASDLRVSNPKLTQYYISQYNEKNDSDRYI